MNFLNNQTDSALTFGTFPTLLPTRPMDIENGSAMSILYKYSEKRQFDNFMHLWMLDYVGHEKLDTSLNVNQRKFDDGYPWWTLQPI